MANPQPILKADDLSKRYEDGVLAVDHLNLNINPGEAYCLLGANGAGKTTTINLFLNFISPTTGTCYVNGIDVTKDPLEAKKYVSFVSENVMLYGNFTARQNLDFFAKLGGKPNLGKNDYYQVMRRVSLQKKAFEQRVKNFSKGMRQKLGISIAVIKNAPGILLDEGGRGVPGDPGRAQERGQGHPDVDPRHLPGQGDRRPGRDHEGRPDGHGADPRGAPV
jgi:ABC-2 type transport system ATP-binding protein